MIEISSISHFSYRGVSTEKSIGHQVLLTRVQRYLDRQCVNDYLDLDKGIIWNCGITEGDPHWPC